jgi:membrane-bound lytic murein transglycosylase B
MVMAKKLASLFLLCAVLMMNQAFAIPPRAEVQSFIKQLVQQHNFDGNRMRQIFDQVEIRPEIIDAMNRPYEAKPWYQYRPLFVTRARIEEGAQFMQQNYRVLQQAQKKYGVPAEIISAIIGVETRYGRHRGGYRVIDALATLGFDYPRRSRFFLSELEQFLLLSREEGFDPLAVNGSYAGAMGKPQFIASSYRRYAVDFDGDGVRDLIDNSADAIGSVANYLARHGWQRGQPVAVPVSAAVDAPAEMGKLIKPVTSIATWRKRGYTPKDSIAGPLDAELIVLQNADSPEYWLGLRNFYAITRYNHSELYAMAVYQLSEGIKRQLGKLRQQAAAN